MKPVRVALHAAEALTRIGLLTWLQESPRVVLTAMEEAEAVVVAVTALDSPALEVLRGLPAPAGARFVLVVSGGWHTDLAVVAEHRIRAVLWRAEVDAPALVRAVRDVAEGRACLPPGVQGTLLDQLERVQREVLGPRGLTASGLSGRELDVLRLLSEGFTLSEIAVELNYSERTIKNVLSTLQLRFGLRNRVQAVSYAIRRGLI
ncbi:response regulator transcription factor [Streptomyces sp. NPDC020996]|uniref:helix-turn-helix transcriptional regulator n=1 Tax=Streptomyces sp. NPDC020996 TaxID=3154791 RepID=UPI0033FFFBC1